MSLYKDFVSKEAFLECVRVMFMHVFSNPFISLFVGMFFYFVCMFQIQ